VNSSEGAKELTRAYALLVVRLCNETRVLLSWDRTQKTDRGSRYAIRLNMYAEVAKCERVAAESGSNGSNLEDHAKRGA
jgi:hypothetical protein